MIKIKSVRELTFDPVTRVTGIIEVEVVSYLRNSRNKTYNLTLQDTVFIPAKTMEEIYIPAKYNEDGTIKEPERFEEVEVDYFETESSTRNRIYKDDELTALLQGMEIEQPISVNNIDDVFRQGLLFITQMECEQGKGIYFSDAQDWEIVNG